jgi:hypothetical protein
VSARKNKKVATFALVKVATFRRFFLGFGLLSSFRA